MGVVFISCPSEKTMGLAATDLISMFEFLARVGGQYEAMVRGQSESRTDGAKA